MEHARLKAGLTALAIVLAGTGNARAEGMVVAASATADRLSVDTALRHAEGGSDLPATGLAGQVQAAAALTLTITPHTVGRGDYSVDVTVRDDAGSPRSGVTVTLTVSGGAFGPGTRMVTRTTNAQGYVRFNWARMADGDSLVATAGGASPAAFVHRVPPPAPIDTTTPPPPPPPSGEHLTPGTLVEALGPLVRRNPAALSPIPAFDLRFLSTEPDAWKQYAANPERMYLLANHYGGLRSRVQWAIRNGMPYGHDVANDTSTYYGRGVHIIRTYLRMIAIPNKFAVPPHNNTGMPDIETYWVLERDSAALNHIHVIAVGGTTDRYSYLRGGNKGSDARQVYVTLQAFSAAHRLGIPYQAAAANPQMLLDAPAGSWKAVGNRQIRWLTDSLPHPFGDGPWVQPDGAIPSPAHENREAYLFNAGLADELFKWWAYVDTTNIGARNLAIRIVRHLVDEWERFGRRPLPYLGNGKPGSANELAGYHVLPGLIAWQETGDMRYRDFALAHLQATLTGYVGQPKQWNQVFSTGAFNAEALLSGVTWR